MTTVKRAVQFEWDEPEGCTTPRGWCHVIEATHPDYAPDAYSWDYFTDHVSGLGCGNYLEYTAGRGYSSKGPDGETVHAVAFVHRFKDGRKWPGLSRSSWHHTVADAKAWIEAEAVRMYARG